MTLRTRLTLIVVAVVAVAVIGGTYAAYLTTSRELRAEVDDFLAERVARLATAPPGALDDVLGPPPEDRDERDLGGNGPDGDGPLVGLDAVTQVIDRDGQVVSAAEGQPPLPVSDRDREIAAGGGQPEIREVSVGDTDYRMITAPIGGGRAVQVARSLEETDDLLAALRTQLALIAAVGAALAGAMAWVVARRTARPIEQLTLASEHVAATQDLSVPIPVAGADEVARLATSFNTMLLALDTSRQQQKRLVMDASHELRTPLTAVRTNIDLLVRASAMPPEQRAELLAETQLELVELTDLVRELVDLATDARAEEPEVDVDLGQVATEVAARFRRRSGRDIELRVLEGGHDPVPARVSMIERAVSNLVENALKFSDAPTAVEIEVRRGRVDVLDRGIGIDEADRTRVFDRFSRADGARTRPGSGLGLAIVAQIAALHGGSARLSPRDGGGAVATLDLAPLDLAPLDLATPPA